MRDHTAQKYHLRKIRLSERIRGLAHVLSLFAVMCSTLSLAETSARESEYASHDHLIVFPFAAPHLNQGSSNQQTRSLIREIDRDHLINVIPLQRVQRGLREQRFKLKSLQKPQNAIAEVKRLCIRLRASHALSVQMKLGTDRKPARLIGTLFFCRDSFRTIERFELPFEGRLSLRVWRLFNEQFTEAISRPPKAQERTASIREHRTPALYPSASPRASTPTIQVSPSAVPMEMPPSSPKPTAIPMAEAEAPSDMSAPENTMMESSRFNLSAGARFLTKSFTYQTAENTRVLRGGLSYDSQWLIGWGMDLQLRPFSGPTRPLRGLTLRASFSRYTYESIRVIRSPFDPPIKVSTPSDLSLWSAGFLYAYPLRTLRRTHQVGFGLSYYGELMNLTPNPEYLGLDLHLAELSFFGEFVLAPSSLYLTLEGGIRPFASLGNRVEELGASAESYGGAASLGIRYRGAKGLSLGFKLSVTTLYTEPIGEGRGGRIGTEAKDQTISFAFNLGYSSDPIHQ